MVLYEYGQVAIKRKPDKHLQIAPSIEEGFVLWHSTPVACSQAEHYHFANN